jgi:hypothetical protein
MTAAASAQGTLRIAMTAADIPKTHGRCMTGSRHGTCPPPTSRAS